MRVSAFVLLFAFCYIECRKTYAPIDKNANLAFINMESGGGSQPPNKVGPAPFPTPAPKEPAPHPTPKPVTPTPVKPTPGSVKPAAKPTLPTNYPSHTTPKPVHPTLKTVTTPGPGSVKQLVTFYDSQGKASPIRPYSYSQAVKQEVNGLYQADTSCDIKGTET